MINRRMAQDSSLPAEWAIRDLDRDSVLLILNSVKRCNVRTSGSVYVVLGLKEAGQKLDGEEGVAVIGQMSEELGPWEAHSDF
jgi:hypothetical protein